MKEGWTEVALREILRARANAPSEEELASGEVRIVSKIKFDTGTLEFRQSSETKTGMIRICPGDLVVSGINAAKGAIAIYQKDANKDASATIHYASYEVNNSLADTKFLWWLLRSSAFRKILEVYLPGGIKTELKAKRFLPIPIPLPPLAEQMRIVAHLDSIEEGFNRIQHLRESARLEIEALTTSLHFSLARDRKTKLNQLLFLDEEQEVIAPDGSYPQVGIRSFGMGMFRKPAVAGSETTYRAFNVLRAGKFVMSQVKGWEGAVGIVGSDLDGWFVSPEYRTFSCISTECDSNYLSFLVSTAWFKNQLASATRGVGARRERVRPEMLLDLEMPFPPIEEQRSAVKMLKRLDAGKHLSSRSSTLEAALIPSILDRVFND